MDRKILDQEIELELAETNKIFDFFQLEYRGPISNPWDQRISMTAAFRLPMHDNKKRLKLAELHNEKLELDLKEKRQKAEKSEKYRRLYQELKTLLHVHEMRQKALIDMEIGSKKIIELYRINSDPGPLFELQQKEMLIKEQISLSRMKIKVLKKYIELLEFNQTLFFKPLKNYLKK